MRREADSQGTSYIFVDNVRFWSMFSIVAMHSLEVFGLMKQTAPKLSMVLTTPFKFGTIGFFLISGFLMGDGLKTAHPGAYMQKRLKKIFLPWLFWFSLMLVYLAGVNEVHTHMGIRFDAAGSRIFGRLLYLDLFGTAFWFVPNLLLGMYVLVVLRKYADDLRLGAGLLVINMFYVVNIYGRWMPSVHTEAVLGFVFYLWLGGYAARRYERLTAWLRGVPMSLLMGAMVVAAGCAFAEGMWLKALGTDGSNTLRLSNQVFAVLVVMVFVKLKKVASPRFVQVRRETFGLYLSHAMLLDIVLRGVQAVFRMAPRGWLPTSSAGLVAEWLMVFAATYSAGIVVARTLAGWDATQWLVGLSAARRPARTASVEEETRADGEGLGVSLELS